jgi:hypothetical protein
MSNPYIRLPQDEITTSFFDENFGTISKNIDTYMQCVQDVLYIEIGKYDFGEIDAELTDEIMRVQNNLRKIMFDENSRYLCDILKQNIADDIPLIVPMKTKDDVCVQTRVYTYAPFNQNSTIGNDTKYDTQYPFTFVVKFYSS